MLIDKYGRPQLLVWPDTPAIPIHLRGKQKGIMQVLNERNPWPENGRRSDGVNFSPQCPEDSNLSECNLDFKGSPGAAHTVCWQWNGTFRSKRADYRKNWSIVDSWLSCTPSATVNSVSLSGTGVAAGGMPGKIVSTH